MNALEKKGEKEGERRRLSVANFILWPQRDRTHAFLAERGGFWADTVEAAGLFGNSPLSGVLGPVTQGHKSLLEDLQTRAPPNIVLN